MERNFTPVSLSRIINERIEEKSMHANQEEETAYFLRRRQIHGSDLTSVRTYRRSFYSECYANAFTT